ncbi:hypothetical protein QR97_25805 [Streptomyces sp. PBH53]|nr:hypothetical protein QR97_25805 [Streptomyces sp. PBH53]
MIRLVPEAMGGGGPGLLHALTGVRSREQLQGAVTALRRGIDVPATMLGLSHPAQPCSSRSFVARADDSGRRVSRSGDDVVPDGREVPGAVGACGRPPLVQRGAGGLELAGPLGDQRADRRAPGGSRPSRRTTRERARLRHLRRPAAVPQAFAPERQQTTGSLTAMQVQ